MEPRFVNDSFSSGNDENSIGSLSFNSPKVSKLNSMKEKDDIEQDEDFFKRFSSMKIESRRESFDDALSFRLQTPRVKNDFIQNNYEHHLDTIAEDIQHLDLPECLNILSYSELSTEPERNDESSELIELDDVFYTNLRPVSQISSEVSERFSEVTQHNSNVTREDEFLVAAEEDDVPSNSFWLPGTVEFEYSNPIKVKPGSFHPLWTEGKSWSNSFAYFSEQEVSLVSSSKSEPSEFHISSSIGLPSLASWSKNGELLAMYFPKKGLLRILSPQMNSFIINMNLSQYGDIDAICWSPEADRILASTTDRTKLLIIQVSMEEDDFTVEIIKRAKFTEPNVNLFGCNRAFPCVKFSSNLPYLAVAERCEGKDYVSIYDCESWTHVHIFQVSSYDLECIFWCDNSNLIAVVDFNLELNIYFYALDGELISTFSLNESEGLGLRTISISNFSNLIAVGAYNEDLHIFGISAIKREIKPCILKSNTLLNHKATAIFLEKIDNVDNIRYEQCKSNMQLEEIAPQYDKLNPGIGFKHIEFSVNDKYIATYSETTPNAIWIWDAARVAPHAVLIQSRTIRNFSWSPVSQCLAICTGQQCFYMWSPDELSTGSGHVIDIPFAGFKAYSCEWNQQGDSLLLMDKGSVCRCSVIV